MLLLSLDVVKEEKKGDDARRLDAALKSWHASIIPNWVGVTEDSHYFKSPGDVEYMHALIKDRRDLAAIDVIQQRLDHPPHPARFSELDRSRYLTLTYADSRKAHTPSPPAIEQRLAIRPSLRRRLYRLPTIGMSYPNHRQRIPSMVYSSERDPAQEWYAQVFSLHPLLDAGCLDAPSAI